MKKNFDLRKFAGDNLVVLIFLVMTIVAIPLSKLSGVFILDQLVTRIARSAFLVFALILPIIAGMGINFAMTLGAMAGQIGLIFTIDWNIVGTNGLLFAMLLGIPISVFLGWFSGMVLNKARGREMVTGFILGYLMDGVYQMFGLYIVGMLIPIRTAKVAQIDGFGVRNTLDLSTLRGTLDKLVSFKIGTIPIPVVTFMIIALLCVFIIWFKKTKLGQDMRAVGEDEHVAHASGIDVDKTRIIAIVISTILACIGQVIYLQNLGNMFTYTSQRQAGYMAAAAILVGGATKKKATITNVFVGVLIIHTLYITLPQVGAQIFRSAQIGQYMSDAINFSVIALALTIHAWRERKNAENARAGLRAGAAAPAVEGAGK